MKKYLMIFFCMLSFFVFSDTEADSVRKNAGISQESESIKNYDVDIQINKDGTLLINEELVYYTPSAGKHGIFRDIPTNFRGKLGTNDSRLIKMNYINRNGNTENYAETVFPDGVRYRVGSADYFINQGENKYTFNYIMLNAVKSKDGIYQVYFNAVGQYWDFPIQNAKVTVHYEGNSEFSQDEIKRFEVYRGKYGETNKDFTYKINKNNIEITAKNFTSKEGLTFLLDLKTTKINITASEKFELFVRLNSELFVIGFGLFLLFIYMLITWNVYGKDPEKKAIIPSFEIPKDVSPMMVAYMNKSRELSELLTIGLLTLASKNHMELTTNEKNNLEYKIQESMEELSKEEKEIKKVFSDQEEKSKGEVKDIDDLKMYDLVNLIGRSLDIGYKKIYKENGAFLFPIISMLFTMLFLTGKSMISPNSFHEVGFIMVFVPVGSVIVFSLGIKNIDETIVRFLLLFGGGLLLFMCLAHGSIIILFFTLIFIIPSFIYVFSIGRYTVEGQRIFEELEGLKMYIKTAEEHQIRKFNDLDDLISFFKKILPYAIALGVKNQCIKLLEREIQINHYDTGLDTRNVMNSFYMYNSSYFISNTVGNLYNSAARSVQADSNIGNFRGPSSGGRGGGGGGFSSGGGFSGGGSGGGGGGSW